MKYTPVAAALAGLAAWRWWRAGQRGEVLTFGATLAVAGGLYLTVHRAVWGGWTVYASGDQFQTVGEFAVIGVNPDYLFRSWRLVGLLVDRDFGLGAWQPGWLLVVPALAALATRPPRGFSALALPLLAGWLVASFPAQTMHATSSRMPGSDPRPCSPALIISLWIRMRRPTERRGVRRAAFASAQWSPGPHAPTVGCSRRRP